jgi:uncharacterized repeat protein (TIGR01451 family)
MGSAATAAGYGSICRKALVVPFLATVGLLLSGSPVRATSTPLWHIRSIAEPTVFRTADGPHNDEYVVSLENLGTAPSSGEIVVTDTLPAGVVTSSGPTSGGDWTCTSGAGQAAVTCTSLAVGNPATGSYHGSTVFHPGQISIPVSVSNGAIGPLTNTVTVSGGGAPESATTSIANPLNTPGSTPFGMAYSRADVVSSPDGRSYSLAGGHPYALTTDVGFNSMSTPCRETNRGPLLPNFLSA